MDSPDELEEERRLMYVAITRARKKLYVTRAKSRFMYGSRERQAPSRFIKEMGLATFEQPVRQDYSSDRYSSYSSNYSGNNYSSGYSSSYGYSSTKTSSTSTTKSYGGGYSTYDEYATKANTFDNKKLGGSGLGNLQGLMNSKLNTQKSKFADYKVGVQVLHTKFGVGTII